MGDMRRIRVPFSEEIVRRYVVSSVKSALSLSRYWKEMGFDDSEAERKALNQAMGMITSGYGEDLKKARDSLLELRYWCDRLLEVIESLQDESEEKPT